MKRVLLITLLFLGGTAAPTNKAHCAACFTNPCISAAFCGRGCSCMKKGMETMGECVSIDTGAHDVR